jgi:ABC-2 type transport system permease protein
MVLVWVLISAYGSQIAMGVGEEKQNRIVEVILASVRPIQLLVGKVTGIGVLALAQAALMVAVFLIYANGASLFYKVLGFFPPTAPVAMPVLYAAGDVPAWQEAVSAVLVAAGTVWMARTAATIYGRSILRTGSRVRLRQVLARGEAA